VGVSLKSASNPHIFRNSRKSADSEVYQYFWSKKMSLSWSQEIYIKAYQFAARAHQGQYGKGTNLPYIMHPTFVSMEIMAALMIKKVSNPELAIQCPLLHNVIEDTAVTYEQLKVEFGNAIADGVLALSKNKKLDKCDQLEESLARIKQQTKEVWMVKLADRIDNLRQPPPDWTIEDIRDYRNGAIRIYAELNKANRYLANRLQEKIKHYLIYLQT
jgi:(p)ppGpp synthase/HD superfamily hydrolase